jgi:hypothetical protein
MNATEIDSVALKGRGFRRAVRPHMEGLDFSP